jgi:hemolysin III
MFFTLKPHRDQTDKEEIANSISHGIGLACSIIAAPFLIMYAVIHGDFWAIFGSSVFIATAIVLYLSSTMYHGLKHGRLKEVFHIVDHSAIFLLIAGTYTPITLGVLKGTTGWVLFTIVWLIAIIGIILKVRIGTRYMKLWLTLYIAMGLLIVVAIRPLIEAMMPAGLVWIAAGGAAYLIGVIFFTMPHRNFAHLIWHILVFAGTACHFVAVLFYTI